MSNFEAAVARLNSRNLPSLWKLCSYLSCIEVFGSGASPISPLWNCEMERLLCDAVLSSRAAPYKTSILTLDDLRYVINSAQDALSDGRFKQEIQSGGDRSEMLYQLRRFFARMGNVQLRPQEPRLFMGAGRLVAMLSTLPRESLGEFPEHYRDLARLMPDEIKTVLGGEVADYFSIHLSILQRHRIIAQQAFSQLAADLPREAVHVERPVERQMRVFVKLFELFFSLFDHSLNFTTDALRKIAPSSVSGKSIESYLEVFSRSTLALRKLGCEPAYNYGPVGWRLSPLERFPIIDLADGSSSYCVPNIRTFKRSFADVIHFTLQDTLGERYNTFRGAAQEVFLQQLVRRRLSIRQLIPERVYRKGRGEFRGPDLTLVEKVGPSLILVESKGRRLLAETRFTMTDGSVDKNLDDAYEALRKLPGKVDDLRSRRPEYADVQMDLDATKEAVPFAVVVLGETTYMTTELLRYRAENESAHPLHGYPFPFAVMGPETFELAVELAAQEGRSLRHVLAEFWEDSGHSEITDTSAELFRDKHPLEAATFAATFLKPLLKDAGLKFED